MPNLTKTVQRTRIKDTAQDKITNAVITIILVFASIASIYPLWYTIIASLSNPIYVNRGEVWLWPVDINLAAYKILLTETSLWRSYGNTIIYTVGYVLLQLAFTLPVSYALARPPYPGKKFINLFIMLPMYFSGGMIPSYLLVKDLGLMDSMWALIIPQGLSFYYIMITKNYFSGNIPESLFESARIDGASTTKFFFKFVIPLSKPIVSCLTLYFAIPKWNSYMEGVLYIQDMRKQTLQVVIRQLTAEIDTTNISGLSPQRIEELIARQELMKFAVVVVGSLPLMLLYPAVQKFLIGGMMVGAVKE